MLFIQPKAQTERQAEDQCVKGLPGTSTSKDAM
jgi:hypothetical protein